MSNIQESLFFSPKGAKNGQNWQNENFPKKWVGVNLYPLMVSNLMQNIKKIKWVNLEQYTKKLILSNCPPTFAPFCPLSGQKGIFIEKWQHLKRLMVFYLHAKKYEKQLNGSKDIVIWKIERSDWSRAFAYKSRE